MENFDLKDDERIDDLELNGLKIIQKKNGFCFGIDSILLSDFAKKIKNGSNVIDLGTGTGILGVLLCEKTNLNKIIGVEIQQEIADMARRTIKMNKLENKFEILNSNIKDLEKKIKVDYFDAIVTNPPYKKVNSGKVNEENQMKLISRHEITAELSDFINVSFKLLKDKGTLYMVHRAERIVDIISEMRKNKLEPKRIRFVYSNSRSDSKLVLIEAVKNGKPFIKVEKALYVYDDDGTYTDEILEIYNKKKGRLK